MKQQQLQQQQIANVQSQRKRLYNCQMVLSKVPERQISSRSYYFAVNSKNKTSQENFCEPKDLLGKPSGWKILWPQILNKKDESTMNEIALIIVPEYLFRQTHSKQHEQTSC